MGAGNPAAAVLDLQIEALEGERGNAGATPQVTQTGWKFLDLLLLLGVLG